MARVQTLTNLMGTSSLPAAELGPGAKHGLDDETSPHRFSGVSMKVIRSAAAAAVLAGALFTTRAALAQTTVEHVAMGDKSYAARNAADALKHYDAAIGPDSSDSEVLWKAARAAVDVGEASTDKATQTRYYLQAEALARRAVKDNPNDAEGHFHLARALGKRALSLGVTDRIKYATSVREQALEALRLDPNHPGALHVMGVWNAEIMRLNGFSRMMAKNFLGGKVFGTANWNDAQRYLERS